jgi:hypothetical protein
MTSKSVELRDNLLKVCGTYEAEDIMRALTEALSLVVIQTSGSAQIANQNAENLADAILSCVRNAFKDNKLN